MISFRFLPAIYLVACSTWAFAQDSLPSTPSLESGTETAVALPPIDIDRKAGILEESVYTGEPFRYRLTLSWQGSADFLSLSPPEVSWPGGIVQTDVSQSVRTEAGQEGPVGVKTFTYTLTAERKSEFELPAIQVELNRPGGKAQIVEIPGQKVIVTDRPPTLGERARTTIRENRILFGGGLLVVVAGLIVFFLSRRTHSAEEDLRVMDPWKDVEAGVKNVEALLSSGENRSFYSSIEAVLRSGLRILDGSVEKDLSRYLESDRLPTVLSDELTPLVSEIQDRKFRPDRPRPEEMARACRRLRAVLAAMKAIEGGKTP